MPINPVNPYSTFNIKFLFQFQHQQIYSIKPQIFSLVVILDFGKTRLPKHTYTEFYDIFQVEQPSHEIDGAIDFEKSQKKIDKLCKTEKRKVVSVIYTKSITPKTRLCSCS